MSIRINVPRHKAKATNPVRRVRANGDASGLTERFIRPLPIVFGNARLQEQLLEIARIGAIRLPAHSKPWRLVTSGLCMSERIPRWDIVALNIDHPAIMELRTFLSDMTGFHLNGIVGNGDGEFDHIRPLGDRETAPFRVILVLAQADDFLTEETVRRRVPSVWGKSVHNALDRLTRDRVLVQRQGGSFALSPDLPVSFKSFVLKLAEVSKDPRLAPSTASGARVAAFNRAADGAPRLFGADSRLRNLMALAKYGTMHYADLRKITGANHLPEEGEGNAPFGRAALVRTWATSDGTALALDISHPIYPALRRLLIRLEKMYPLAPYVPAYRRPRTPPRRAWNGDRYVLFGGIIPTTVLVSIGVLGWTFEVLICKIDEDRHRENVRTSITSLEEQGLLQASRPHGPGFNARVLTISDAFPAKAELIAVLRAYARAWPDTERVSETPCTALHHGAGPISRDAACGRTTRRSMMYDQPVMTKHQSDGLKIWGSTGANVPDLSGTYELPPGNNGDRERRSYLADVQTALYSAVGSAQRAPIMEDRTVNAVHQLVIANAALVASESEAFLTLISIGLEAPAQVHLRAIGEMTRRVVLCGEHRDLALELYDSAEPSWRKMVSKLPVDDAPEFARGEKDMRALEQLPRFKDAQADVIERFQVLNELEWTMLSKRSHGDIYALVQVSQSLRDRGAEVRPAINMTQPASVSANVMLSRAYGWVLLCFANIAAEFGIQTNGRADQLFEKFKAKQENDERTGVLRIKPVDA